MDFRNGMNADKSRYGRGYKFVNVLDVIAEAPILDEKIIGRVDADSDEVARFGLKAGDIVFQRSSETREDAGQANAYIGDGEALFGGFVIRGRPKVSLDAQYMASLLRTDNARKNITNLAGGSTRFNVGQETLSSVQILIAPTLPEQKKIAAFLSALDDKLAAIEAQLTEWREYKRGMMQGLFSQTLRFKADDGSDFPDWENKQLSDVADIVKGKQLSRDNMDSEALIPVINGGKTLSGYTEEANEAANTITISEGGNSCGYVGFQSEPFWLGGHCYAIRPKKIESNIYLFQCLKDIQTSIMRLRVGSGLPNIQKGDLNKLKVAFPALPEQQKIADFLSSIDAKIEALTIRLEATQDFKRGLLQKMFV